MLLANYGSDSGSDSESGAPIAPPPKPAPISATSSSSRVPQPKKKKPIKITLDLPKASSGSEDEKNIGDNHEVGGDERETKRAKLPKGGKGTSSLLGMLPPPKRKLPQSSTSATKGTGLTVNKSMGRPQLPAPPKAIDENSDDEDNVPKVRDMLPASLARKQQKVESKEEVIDVFGLSKLPLLHSIRTILILLKQETASAPLPKPTIATPPSLKPPSISSAPVAPDFIPPNLQPTTHIRGTISFLPENGGHTILITIIPSSVHLLQCRINKMLMMDGWADIGMLSRRGSSKAKCWISMRTRVWQRPEQRKKGER